MQAAFGNLSRLKREKGNCQLQTNKIHQAIRSKLQVFIDTATAKKT